MNEIAEQRPSFFEGEVLSASDLEQLVVYVRDQSARHLLGGHTWGIVAGLQLLEQAATTDSVDVYVLPGYAVDGFGRAIVVVTPLRLDVAAFANQPSGPVQVWIRYDQDSNVGARPGFQVCCNGGDSFSRVEESYAIEVGSKSLASQQSSMSIGGETVDDARTALRVFDDTAPVMCDGSVPFQDLPLADDTKSHWLISLGEVNWQQGTPGQFVTLVDDSDPDKTAVTHSRRLRRYAGVVAENVYASDGLIRLRRRTTEVGGTVTQKAIDTACTAEDLASPVHERDVVYCGDQATPTELVWVEGKMRVTDDARILAPGRLELRDANSTNYVPAGTKGNVPTFLQRTDDAKKNIADLAIVIGKAEDDNTHNRLLIQQASNAKQASPCEPVTFDLQPLVTVLDTGNVGIGTDTPDELLAIANGDPTFIHVIDTASKTELYVGAGKEGAIVATTGSAATNALLFRTGGTDASDDKHTQMTIVPTGQVGIGTENPDPGHQATIEHKDSASLLLRTDDDAHEAVVRAGTLGLSAGAFVGAKTSGDPLVLCADAEKPYVWVTSDGKVGVHSSTPAHDIEIVNLTAKAEIGMQASGGGPNRQMVLGAEPTGVHAGAFSNDDFRLKTNNATRVMITADGHVGVGTEFPTRTLDVHGEIGLSTSTGVIAAGALATQAIIAGTYSAAASTGSGTGWTGTHNGGTGIYTITFSAGFSNPLVTVTLSGSGMTMAIPVVTPTSNGFIVFMWSPNFPGFTDFGFNFIAIASR